MLNDLMNWIVRLAIVVSFTAGALGQAPMESVGTASLAYGTRSAVSATATKLSMTELFAQMGLSAGSLICSGNALDRTEAWTFKHRKPPALKGLAATDTELAGMIDMEVLGYSEAGSWKSPSSTAPKAAVKLGTVTSTQTVKVTVAPSDETSFEFWGSLVAVYTVSQEAGRTDATWLPASISMKLAGTSDTGASAEKGAATLTVTLGAFKRQIVSSAPSNALQASASTTSIPSFAFISGGTYSIGSVFAETGSVGYEKTLSPFYVAKNLTTKAQWDVVRFWGVTNGYTDLAYGYGKAANHPVHSVGWYEVLKWANAASEKDGLTPCYRTGSAVYRTGSEVTVTYDSTANGYRLPTEVEWEVAARGGLAGKRFPCGDLISQSQANYAAAPSRAYDLSESVNNFHPTYAKGEQPYTSPVGSFAANGYGLFDMAGNVSQWCWNSASNSNSYWDSRSSSTQYFPGIIRGGSWDRGAAYCRIDWAAYDFGNYAYNNRGFRLARSRP